MTRFFCRFFPCYQTKISPGSFPRGSRQYSPCLVTALQCLFLQPLKGWSTGKVAHLLMSFFLFSGQIFFLVLTAPSDLSLSSPDGQLRLFLTFLGISSLFSSVTVCTTRSEDFAELFEDPFALKIKKGWFSRPWILLLSQLCLSVLLTVPTVCLVLTLRYSPLTTYRVLYCLLLTLVSFRLYVSATVYCLLFYSTFRCTTDINDDLEIFKGGPLGTTVFKLQRLTLCLSIVSRLTTYSLGFLFSPIFLLLMNQTFIPLLSLVLLPALVLTLQSVVINMRLDCLKTTSLRLLDFQLMSGSSAVMIAYFSFMSRVEHLQKLAIFGFILISRPVLAASVLLFFVVYLRREY